MKYGKLRKKEKHLDAKKRAKKHSKREESANILLRKTRKKAMRRKCELFSEDKTHVENPTNT